MKAILTKYYGPTSTKGSRIKAYDCDGNSVTIPYDHSLSYGEPHLKAAKALIEKMGWSYSKLHTGSIKFGYAIVIED